MISSDAEDAYMMLEDVSKMIRSFIYEMAQQSIISALLRCINAIIKTTENGKSRNGDIMRNLQFVLDILNGQLLVFDDHVEMYNDNSFLEIPRSEITSIERIERDDNLIELIINDHSLLVSRDSDSDAIVNDIYIALKGQPEDLLDVDIDCNTNSSIDKPTDSISINKNTDAFSLSSKREKVEYLDTSDAKYFLQGVRGRKLWVFSDKCILKVEVTAGSILTGNLSDGTKIIFYKDVIGLQFRESKSLIGYLQFETASGLMNNKADNMFNENTFTFEKNSRNNPSNETIIEVLNYIVHQVSLFKKLPNVSSADEIKKYKELLDNGAISADEYEAKKKQLLSE